MSRRRIWLRQLGLSITRLWRYQAYFGHQSYEIWAKESFSRGAVNRPFRVKREPNDVTIRLGTTDVEVFGQVIANKAYDLPIPPPKTIIDGGANIGLSSVFFAERYPHSRILSLEPDAANFQILQENVRPYKNVVPLRGAIWGRNEMLKLQHSAAGAWGHSVHAMDGSERTNAHVRGWTVDSLMDLMNWNRCDLIKLDVEGSELEIFRHAESWIPRVETIAVELHDRFVPGCSRVFYRAVHDFPEEIHIGELTVVSRLNGHLIRSQNPRT